MVESGIVIVLYLPSMAYGYGNVSVLTRLPIYHFTWNITPSCSALELQIC